MKELLATFDSRASFYNKAMISESDNTIALFSYGEKVALIENEKAVILDSYGQTTMRHIKEFLLQNGFIANNRKQMETDYLI